MINFIKQVFQGKSIYRILFNEQVQKHCQNLDGICLDLASGQSASYEQYLSFTDSAKLIKSDYNKDKDPDMVVDFDKPLPLDDSFIDNILFFNAIYIVQYPEILLKEIYRVLKPGGWLFIASPFILNEAREPNDFRRLTSQGLESLLTDSQFKDLKIIPYGNRFSASAYLLNSFWLLSFIRLFVYVLALGFDKLVPRKINKLHPCPLGYFVIARK